jgi:hypothetical protein
MICALLIFQSPQLPAPLWRLSPWLDPPDVPAEQVAAELAGQRHRRFIKTHTPLAAIPDDARVTYIVTARHPVDAFISMYHQVRLQGPPHPPPGPGAGAPPWPPGPPSPPPGLPPGPPPSSPGPPAPPGPPPARHGPPPAPHGSLGLGIPGPPAAQRPADMPRAELHTALLEWIGDDGSGPRPASLPATMRQLSQAWARRTDPNVVLVHYDDLLADLDRQMRRLADRLGIAVPEPAWAGLVEAATFTRMRERHDLLPPPPPGIPADNGLFFRRGTSGASREILSAGELAWYHSRVARLAPPDLVEWLHRR